MARRGKTKVGGGPPQDTMLAAGSRGRASQEQAEAQQLDQIQQGGDRVAGAIREGIGGVAEGYQRREAGKAQGEQQDFENKMTTRGMELEEAKAGFEQAPEGEQAPEQALSSKTPEEQQRLVEQGDKPIEISGEGPATPGAQEPGGLRQSEAGKSAQQTKQYQADTARMNAMTNRMNAEKSFASARARGDSSGMGAAAESMRKGMDGTRKRLNEIASGDSDPEAILNAYSDNPNAQEALASGDPATMASTAKRLVESELAYQNIAYMAATGSQPVDRNDSNPVWQRYAQNERALRSALRTGQPVDSPNDMFDAMANPNMGSALQAWSGVRTVEEGDSLVRRMTAKGMMNIPEAQRTEAAMAKAARDQAERAELESKLAASQDKIAMLEGAMTGMGSPEFGQPVPKTTEELPGGQQIESGMDFRRGQYQSPEELRKKRNPGTTSYKSSYVK